MSNQVWHGRTHWIILIIRRVQRPQSSAAPFIFSGTADPTPVSHLFESHGVGCQRSLLCWHALSVLKASITMIVHFRFVKEWLFMNILL